MSATATSVTPGDDAARLGGRERILGVRVLLGLVALGVVLSVGQSAVQDDPPATELAVEPIERLAGERPWVEAAGSWGVVDDQLRVVELAPEQGRNLLLADLGWLDGEITAVFAEPVAGAGLVFRARGPDDFWLLVPAPSFSTWAVQHVVDDEAVFSQELGLRTVAPGTRAALSLAGGTVRVTIADGEPTIIGLGDVGGSTDGQPAATGAGLTVAGFGSEASRWSSFEAVREP